MKIRELDLPIVKAFLEREAWDYSNKCIQLFAKDLLKKITEGLTTYQGEGNYLYINSYSNPGLLSRSLILTPDPWGLKGNVNVNLCTCGNLECWGRIIFPSKAIPGHKKYDDGPGVDI